MNNTDDIEQKLTLNMNTTKTGQSLLDRRPYALGNRPPSYLKTRYCWTDINDKYYQGINMTININPDPSKIEDYNNRKLVNNILCEYIDHETKIMKAVGVYEYGSKGKEYGKLHYHIAIKILPKDRTDIENQLLKLFNQKSNCKHRTLQTKMIKDVKHRQDYINYMKKESQNKIKCLFVKNI